MKNNTLIQNLLMLLCVAAPFTYAAFIWDKMPDIVATHFGIDGRPDRFGSKKSALLAPIILMGVSLVVSVLLKNIDKIDPKKAAQNSKETLNKLANIIVIFMSGLSIYILHSALTGEIGNFLFVMMGALFVVLGNFIHSVKPNYFVGIRLPWTLESADNWRKTHQLGSKIWVVGGILIILLALILPQEVLIYAIMGIILTMVLIPAVYSYREFKKNG